MHVVMRALTIFFVMLLGLQVQAQTDSTNSVLRVVGTGKTTVIPDLGVVNLQIELHRMEFADVASALNERYNTIIRRIEEKGYNRKDVKTSSYQINKHSIYRQGHRIDSGYIGYQVLSIEFENTSGNLSNIIKTFTEGFQDVNARFSFKLSDASIEDARKKMLKLAMRNARDRAEVMAKTENLTLHRIKEINYGIGSQDRPLQYAENTRIMSMSDQNRGSESDPGFEIREVELEDSIEVTWYVY